MSDTSDLEQLAQTGEPHAQFAAGIELLSQTAGPSSALGIPLVEAAAAAGHAEAICQLATIEAVGAGRSQNFGRALDRLQDAAELGSDHARAQLKLLSEDATGSDWAAIRDGIDLDALTAVPTARPISQSPRVRTIEGFASKAVCGWVIARTRDKLGRAMIWNQASGKGEIDPARNNRSVELRLTELDVVTELLRARISIATRLPEPVFEAAQVMHYSAGQEFRLHHDYLEPTQPGQAADFAQRGQRIATFLLYLNEDFEGGETDFPQTGIAHRGRTGDALFFANITRDGRPDPLTVHAGMPPTEGEKWILSQWIRERTPGASSAS